MEHKDIVSDHVQRITAAEERAKSAHHRIDGLESKVEKHDEQLGDLSCASAANEKVVGALCSKLDDLISTIKWMIGLGVPSLLTLAGLLVGILFKK